jgi:hypothetical protein
MKKIYILLIIFCAGISGLYAQMSNWGYKKNMYVMNTNAVAYQGIQVAIVINTADLISAGKLNPDGSDLRFMDDSETYEFPYWIESGMNTATTKVWVKVSNMPASTRTRIVMYYGNVTATPKSNGDSTFIFFDDFSVLDTVTKWNSYKEPGVSLIATGGKMIYSGSGYASLVSRNMGITAPFIVNTKINGFSAFSWDLTPVGYAKENTSFTRVNFFSGVGLREGTGISNLGNAVSIAPSTNITSTLCTNTYEFVSKVNADGSCTIATPGGSVTIPASSSTITNATRINLGYYYNSGNASGTCSGGREYDNIFVRKYVAIEPTLDSMGSESIHRIQVYYSKSSGLLNDPASWGSNSDGTGTPPPNFNTDGIRYCVYNNPSPTINGNWFITGSNTVLIFGNSVNTMNVSIPAGLLCGADSIYVRNNVTLSCDGNFITNKPRFDMGSTVQYTSTSGQTITAGIYGNLVVVGGTKLLNANTSVQNTLAILSDINCSGYQLTLGTGIAQTGTLTYGSGKIIGTFSRWFAAATNSGSASGIFPVGTSADNRPIQVEYNTAPTSGGILTANFVASNPGNAGLVPALNDFTLAPIVSINKMHTSGYWTLTASNGITGGSYTVSATCTNMPGINSISSLRLLRRTNAASAWSLSGSSVAATGTVSAPVIARSGFLTAGGEFGLGSDSSVNPLPVKWLSVKAEWEGSNVKLLWSTSSEDNNSHFEIEQSLDNTTFQSLGKVNGMGTSSSVNQYAYTDLSPLTHNVKQIYYRIKQVDFDGKYEYSQTVNLAMPQEGMNQLLSIYPNPSAQSVWITGLTREAIIYDVLGNEIKRLSGDGEVDLSEWKQGVYVVRSGKSTQKLIKY